MYLVRRVFEKDFAELKSLVLETELGFVNLPKEEKALRIMFDNALASFESKSSHPFYFFVLVNNDKLIGTAGIYAAKPDTEFYHLAKVPLPPLFPETPPYVSIISRVHYSQGISEIGALFLTPKERKEGLGKLLSLSRFHFMASDLSRFTKNVYAELRGFITEEGVCPFWEAIGRHFFPVDYEILMGHREHNAHIADDLMPKHPIYLELLAIDPHLGDTHQKTKPALEMLLKQGFQETGDFDLYDGGPRVLAEVAKIKTVRESYRLKIESIENSLTTAPVIVSNDRLNFHACYGRIDRASGAIDKESALLLEVEVGDTVRCSL